MSQAKYFNLQKKNNPNYFKDFNFLSFNIDKKILLDINKCIIDLFSHSEGKKFNSMNQVMNFLNKTHFYKLKRDLNIMTKLEGILCGYFSKIKVFNKSIKGIQFPLDIRIAHPKQPKKLKKKKYLTSSIHCDTWTEEPKDIINGILYLSVNDRSPKINILKTSESEINTYKAYAETYKTKFFLNSRKYFSILKDLKKKKSCKLDHKNGQVMIFNGFTPHFTVRKGKEVRLSLEFRVKTKNPYENVNAWSKLNNHARYWFLPNKNVNNFSQRLKQEYLNIRKMRNYQQLINKRNKEIEKNLI